MIINSKVNLTVEIINQEKTMSDLSFATLRKANIIRLPQFKNPKGEPAHSQPDGSDWTVQEWINAILGEVGETANLLKKVRRDDMSLEEALPELSKEFSDIIVYHDLTLHRIKMPLLFNWNVKDEIVAVNSFNTFANIQKQMVADSIAAGHPITRTKSEIFSACIIPLGKMMDATNKLDGLASVQQERPDIADSLQASLATQARELQNASTAFFCTVAAAAIECGVDLAASVRDKFNQVSERVGADVFIHEDDIVVDRNGSEIIIEEAPAAATLQ